MQSFAVTNVMERHWAIPLLSISQTVVYVIIGGYGSGYFHSLPVKCFLRVDYLEKVQAARHRSTDL